MEHTKGKVEKIWQLKFGTKDKPHYLAKCKWCDISYGQHYETECPDTQVKKLAKINDALLAACELTEKRLLTHGEWDDNCFYYAGHSASELEEPLRKLKAAIAAAGEK